MWAFAGATTITRHRHPDRPLWHLRAGTVVFAGEGAALNFIHGFTPFAGAVRGIGAGIVMALVSVAGVVAHQLITAGPQRSRAARAARRRERAIRRAALHRATAVIDAQGDVRLVHKPGAVAVGRRWYGRAVLESAAHPALTWLPWPVVLPGTPEPGTARSLEALAAAAVTTYRDWRSMVIIPPPEGRPQPRAVPAVSASVLPPRSALPGAAQSASAAARKVHLPQPSRSAPEIHLAPPPASASRRVSMRRAFSRPRTAARSMCRIRLC